MSKISIIVPIYNGQKFIDKCISMILKQTFTDFELILIDDGSTDNSHKICDDYSKKDKRIRVIKKNNGGAWSARNKGIDVSNSKYIMFLDCDDWYEDTLLEEMYKSIENNKVDLVICGQTDVIVNNKNKIIKFDKVLPGEYFYKNRNELLDNYIYLRQIGVADVLWNKIYKTEIIKKYNLRFENFRRGEDAIFNIKYYENVKKCIVINKSLYNYRVEKENPVWLKYSKDYYNVLLKENESIINKLKEIGEYSDVSCEFQSRHFIYGIINYFFWVDYSKNKFKLREKREKISNIINRIEVQNSLTTAKIDGKFNNIIVKFIKSNNILFILLLVRIKTILKEINYFILCNISKKSTDIF